MDYEKGSSLSSDEGMQSSAIDGIYLSPSKAPHSSPTNPIVTSSNNLLVQPMINLGQSLPNLNLNSANISSSNTLLVPGVSSAGTHTHFLSPSHRGISYPPPSPTRYRILLLSFIQSNFFILPFSISSHIFLFFFFFYFGRATLRRGIAFSSSIKNPPLTKTRNIQSQNSFSTSPITAHASSSSSVTELPVSSFGFEPLPTATTLQQRYLAKQQLYQKSNESDV